MEQGKGTKSSSSSELSGSKVPPSSNSRILDSTFPPQSKSLAGKRQDSLNELLNTKPGSSGEPSKGNEGESRNVATGKVGPIFQEQCIPPCTLSSSIFYGGQDNYPLPKTKQDSVYNDEDDSGYATRGNWWKGIMGICLLLSLFMPINILIKVHRKTQAAIQSVSSYKWK